jgi:hypothetical protein
VTHTGEVVGGGLAGRLRAYHQHPLTRRRRVDGNLPALAERLVAEEPLHRVDAHITGRSVRQAAVWLARLDPTSKVIANGLRMSFSSGS